MEVAVDHGDALGAVGHGAERGGQQAGDGLEQVGAAVGLAEVDAEGGGAAAEGDQFVQADAVQTAEANGAAGVSGGDVEDERGGFGERRPALGGHFAGDFVGEGDVADERDEVPGFFGDDDVGVEPTAGFDLDADLAVGKVDGDFAVGEFVVGVAVAGGHDLFEHCAPLGARRVCGGHRSARLPEARPPGAASRRAASSASVVFPIHRSHSSAAV